MSGKSSSKRRLHVFRDVVALGLSALILVSFVWMQRTAFAEGETLTTLEANGYRHVLELDDLLLLIRYELPITDWQNSTFMRDSTCDDTENFTDPCYTSLNAGAALQTFFDGPAATASLVGVRHLPRVGHGLAGIYLSAGHGLTFGTATYEACVQGSASLFVTIPQNCIGITWKSTSTTLAETVILLQADITQLMLNLESEVDVGKEVLVDATGITIDGRVFPVEAFSLMQVIAPGAFFAAVDPVLDAFAPTPGAGALETSLVTAAQASTVYIAAEDVADEFFGISVRALWGTLVLGIAAVIMVAVLFFAPGVEGAAVGALFASIFVGFGVYLGFVSASLVFVALAIIVVLGLTSVFRRIPA